MIPESHPILTCEEAKRFEAELFAGDEAKEWRAMEHAGRAIAEAVLRDIQEIGGLPVDGSLAERTRVRSPNRCAKICQARTASGRNVRKPKANTTSARASRLFSRMVLAAISASPPL